MPKATKKQKKKEQKEKQADPIAAIMKQLDEYDEGTPIRTDMFSTWGE